MPWLPGSVKELIQPYGIDLSHNQVQILPAPLLRLKNPKTAEFIFGGLKSRPVILRRC